jgi:sialate O-acetylesterase
MRTPTLAFLAFAFLLPRLAAEDSTPVGAPFLSPIFGDNMVLQRDRPNTIWGWSKPGDKVRVGVDGRFSSGVAGPDGRWQAEVIPPPPGKALVVTVDGTQHAVLHNVLVGDVWLCGGQSNMEFGLPRANNGAEEVAGADHPDIRFFKVAPHPAYAPALTPTGTWKVCSPQTVAENPALSAVAYFFACRIQQSTGIPIGLVVDCLGGTPVETWMDPATLQAMPEWGKPMAEISRLRASHEPGYGSYLMHWFDDYDAGAKGKTWADPGLDDSAWKTVPLLGGFEAFGLSDVPAVCWFRREVTLPDPLPPGDATLYLGVVEKMDTAYVNGTWVGASSWVENPRVYHVPASVLRPGRNVIALRVFKLKSKAGFMSPPETLRLKVADGTEIPLAGDWKGIVSVDARPPHPLPLGYENYPTMPSVLFQGMIRPVAPLAIRGALWYQGEANAVRAHQYRTLLPAMIQDWRNAFGQGGLPFYIVSLPAFQPRRDQPGDDEWAELREAQALTAQTVPNSGLVVTIDTGDAGNIHPTDKKPVGERLALLALAKTYGKDLVYSGPVYRSAQREGAAMRVQFDHTEGGLMIHGIHLEEFSVAGSDHVWHWADARIEGDTVVASSAEVPAPVAVRYAWQSNPKATLFNDAGLPAGPFRSDDWPGITDHRDPW